MDFARAALAAPILKWAFLWAATALRVTFTEALLKVLMVLLPPFCRIFPEPARKGDVIAPTAAKEGVVRSGLDDPFYLRQPGRLARLSRRGYGFNLLTARAVNPASQDNWRAHSISSHLDARHFEPEANCQSLIQIGGGLAQYRTFRSSFRSPASRQARLANAPTMRSRHGLTALRTRPRLLIRAAETSSHKYG